MNETKTPVVQWSWSDMKAAHDREYVRWRMAGTSASGFCAFRDGEAIQKLPASLYEADRTFNALRDEASWRAVAEVSNLG